ncbi:MAG: rhomboid family intramembrane serine protease [Saprospiraceae bacterium]|nr:rhomboid family intramembrane serine protease [Saprospiraceae bacterium]
MSITLIIVAITVLASIQAFNNLSIFDKFRHAPYIEHRHKEYYRWLTSGFLHVDYIHLAVNMFVFYQFGEAVEGIYQDIFSSELGGSLLFLLMYLTSIVCGDLVTFVKHKDNPYYTAVGASGGVSGVLFAFVLFSPWSEIRLYGIIPLPTIAWGVLYLAYEQWASRNSKDNIGHDAHFFGALAGMVVTIVLEPKILTYFVDQIVNKSPYW